MHDCKAFLFIFLDGKPNMNARNETPELLAPVGQIESFFAAAENGANAVYLGLKQLSARASATNFTLDDLSGLVPYAHSRGVSVYVAMNSLVTAPELPAVPDMLQSLSDIGVDALIVQDPGVFYLARKRFPKLKIHASTLMTAHNHAGVNHLARQGAERVVLARELTIDEIRRIAEKTEVDLEIFVHGALCFSYSGLCLASSFRGGHSGLQGRCVQPCRLRFRQSRKDGYYLSCNDFCALPFLSELKKLRLAAFKIEGRKKSADYIAKVVKAYRIAMDAPPEREAEAIAEARELLAQSPARHLTAGFLGERPGAEVLTPGRSGFSGLMVGTVEEVVGDKIVVALKEALHPGARLRPESDADREESAFTASELLSAAGNAISYGRPGGKVQIAVKGTFHPGDRLYRVGEKGRSASSLWQEVRRKVSSPARYAKTYAQRAEISSDWPEPPPNPRRAAEALLLKINGMQDLTKALQSPADNVMLMATRANLERMVKQRLSADQKKRFIWSLPTLLTEKEVEYYRPAVSWFVERGFHTWEVNNCGHFDFFPDLEKVQLVAGSRLNVRNQAAIAAMAEYGCEWVALSIECSRDELQAVAQGPLSAVPIVTVFTWPPIFTSRLTPKLREDKPFTSPKAELYFLRKRWGQSYVYADQPLNWFGELPVLRSQGFRNFLIDMSEGPTDQTQNFERILSGFKRMRPDEPFSLFNFDRVWKTPERAPRDSRKHGEDKPKPQRQARKGVRRIVQGSKTQGGKKR